MVALAPTGFDTNVPWLGSRPDLLDKRPALEFLSAIDRFDGSIIPQLATSWTMAPDARSWTFDLREGVQFHDGRGEFTAQDLIHTIWTITREDSTFADRQFYEGRIGSGPDSSAIAGQFELEGDHRVTIRLLQPAPTFIGTLSEESETAILSKAFWDAEGLDGYLDKLVGTGPYEFRERAIGQFALYERVDNHWRGAPASFREIQFLQTREASTRLALLLTGEAHITNLTTDLLEPARAAGMDILRSGAPAVELMYHFVGLYFVDTDKLDTSDPMTDIRVRQAMNMAINRQEIMDALLPGKAEPLRVTAFHPSLPTNSPGFNPAWDDRFEDKYGYNPQRARELLAEAGYAGGGPDFVMYVAPLAGIPELPNIAEAIAADFSAVGLRPDFQEVDRSVYRATYRAKEGHNFLWPNWTGPISQEVMVRFHGYSVDGGWTYEDTRVDQLYLQLVETIDPDARSAILRQVGDIWFDNYFNIPLFWIFTELVVDPNVVAEYVFPGTIIGSVTHLEYVTAAP